MSVDLSTILPFRIGLSPGGQNHARDSTPLPIAHPRLRYTIHGGMDSGRLQRKRHVRQSISPHGIKEDLLNASTAGIAIHDSPKALKDSMPGLHLPTKSRVLASIPNPGNAL